MQFLESSGKVDGKVAPGFQEGVMRVVGGGGVQWVPKPFTRVP